MRLPDDSQFEKGQNFVIKLQKSLADKGSIFEHNIPWSYAILIIKRTSHSFITTNSRGAHNWTKELANLKKTKKPKPIKTKHQNPTTKILLERFIAHKTPNTTLTTTKYFKFKQVTCV